MNYTKTKRKQKNYWNKENAIRQNEKNTKLIRNEHYQN